MRDYTEENGETDVELEKFIINSILSAANTEDMDSSDQNDIINKIETGTGDDDDSTEDEFGGEEVDDDFEEKGEEETDEGLMREIDWEPKKDDNEDLDPKLYPDGWKELDGMMFRNANNLSNEEKSLTFEENNDMELNQMIDEMLGSPAEAPVETPTETPVERPTETPNPVDDPRYSPFNPPKPNENPDPKGNL